MPVKSPFETPNLRFELQKLAFVALGSNLGDPRDAVLRAMDRLQAFSGFPLLRSSLWRSDPVDCPPGSPPFVNAVAGLLPRQDETPEHLLGELQQVERDFGRRPKQVLNEPRPLDLDLVAFRAETRQSPALTLPHPRAHLRAFVLRPLGELAADLVLPGQVLSVRQLLETLDPSQRVSRLG